MRFVHFRKLERGSRASDHLDLLRGMAAIAVPTRSSAQLFLWILSAKRFAKSCGRWPDFPGELVSRGRDYLSGYLIGTSVVKGAAGQRWGWSSYTIKRASRLYVVLLPALLLTAVVDHLGIRLFGGVGNIYSVRKPGFKWAFTSPDAGRLGAEVFLGNALYLQGFLVPSYGSNMALWSLSFEWWFYFLFPVLVLAGKWTRVIGAVLAGIAAYLAGFMFIGYFGIWLMGTALNTRLFASFRWLTGPRAFTIFIANLFLVRLFKLTVYHDTVPRIPQGCLDYEVGIIR
jgi:peptidoglycan/LPS O-acetylase OafA/YrhL